MLRLTPIHLATLLGMLVLATGCGDATKSGSNSAAAANEPPFEMLDLETFTLLPDAKPPMMRSGTMLMYSAPGKLVESYNTLKAKLSAAHWRELPGGNVSEQYETANGFFQRGDHVLTLSLYKGSEPGLVSVTMQHHGNLDLSKLPLPKDAKSVYQFPHTVGYVTAGGVDETSKAFHDAMLAAGWTVAESSPGSNTYKRGAQTLQAYISSAPAQEGKTMMQLSPQLLPVDLPTPAHADDIRFSHRPVELTFHTTDDWDTVAKFYQAELPKLGWKPTTENLIKNENDAFQIYRNDAKALAQVKLETRGGKTNVKVEYQSPTAFAQEEKRFQEYKKKMEEEKKVKEAAKAE